MSNKTKDFFNSLIAKHGDIANALSYEAVVTEEGSPEKKADQYFKAKETFKSFFSEVKTGNTEYQTPTESAIEDVIAKK